jgi:hypothetical protein
MQVQLGVVLPAPLDRDREQQGGSKDGQAGNGLGRSLDRRWLRSCWIVHDGRSMS